MTNNQKSWALDKPSLFVGAILGVVFTWVFTTSWMTPIMVRGPSLSSSETPSMIELQTFGLRKAAAYLYAGIPVPDRDVTKEMIGSLAYRHVADQRLVEALSQIYVDDGFPREDVQAKLLRKQGGEVRIIGKDGEFYVHFLGASLRDCEGIKYAICSLTTQ